MTVIETYIIVISSIFVMKVLRNRYKKHYKSLQILSKPECRKCLTKLLRFWIISFLLLSKIWKIPQYKEQDPKSDSFSDPVMTTIVKYRAHLSIIAIKENCTSDAPFNFSSGGKEDILKK